jgi:pimeloyl-ACP methyl ester carboxylesterase
MRRFRSWDGTELAYRVAGNADMAQLLGAGHFPWVDDAASFAATVQEFLARRPAPPGV